MGPSLVRSLLGMCRTCHAHPSDPDAPGAPPTDWQAQELLLLREVMKLVGRSLSPEPVLREMLHLMSELLGLNRGRIVLQGESEPDVARIRLAYGLTARTPARLLRARRRHHRPCAGQRAGHHRAGHRRRVAVPVPQRAAQ
jgi:hypothetical protein